MIRHYPKQIIIYTVAVLSLVTASCAKGGQEKIRLSQDEVHFDANGGETTVEVYNWISLQGIMAIGDDGLKYYVAKTNTPQLDDETTTITYDWLSVQKVKNEETFILDINVSENTTGKQRTLFIDVWGAGFESCCRIPVTQSATL